LTDTGIISLSKEIGSHFPHLEKLQLDFSRYPSDEFLVFINDSSPRKVVEISDTSMKELAVMISKHGESLKYVDLGFNG